MENLEKRPIGRESHKISRPAMHINPGGKSRSLLVCWFAIVFGCSVVAQSPPPALAARISAALISRICHMDAPQFHHYGEYREFKSDGTWRALDKRARGTWSIAGDKLVVKPSAAKNPEYYTLSPGVLEGGIGKLHLTGIGVSGDPITLDSTDQVPEGADPSRPGSGTPNYFGTARPGN